MEDEQLDIDINTEKLISLIKDQPTIYDKALPPLDQKEKQILWFNICKELVPGFEERRQLEKTQIGIKVYSRWKNLRTCFRREYNLQKEESKSHRHGNPFIQKKRKKYEFYDQLLFLLPNVAVKKCSSKSNSSQESVPKERTMTSRAVSPVVFEDTTMSASVQIPGINLPSIQISRVGAGQAAQPTAPSQASQSQPTQPAHQFAPGQAAQPVPPCQTAQQSIPRPTVDEDRHFLLSVLPALQRMSRSQKLKAKMKFLQALSDVDAETQETLQRYVCYSRHAPDQDYNRPEPFPGGVPVRPFVMQADHAYYLVRERGNKRARMVPETPETDRHDKCENECYHEYAIGESIPEMEEDAKSHESIEIGHPDHHEDAKSDESVEFGGLQQTADSSNLQGNLEAGNVQQTGEVGGPQNPVEVEGTDDSDVVDVEDDDAQEKVAENIENSEEPNFVQEADEVEVKVGDAKDNVEEDKEKETDEADSKESVEAISQENINDENVQFPAEVGNLEDNVENFTTQENVKSGGDPGDIAVVKDEIMLEMSV